MPIYEYVCPNCEVRFERLRPMSGGQSAECPTCSARSPRVLSVFAAMSVGANGESLPMAGGGCACAEGGSCACAGGSSV